MTKVYFPNLNGLRFFAAMSVMIYHFYGIDILNGHLGVVLFFVLSGFLISYLLFEEIENTKSINIKNFYWRRILRIWPLYFFIILIASIVYFIDGYSQNDYFEFIPLFIFFVPNLAFVLDISFKYAGILWSVGSEEQFYLCWPWLFKIKSKKKILTIFFLIAIFFTVVPHTLDFFNSRIFNSKTLYIVSHMIQRMNFSCMAIGGVLAYLTKYKKNFIPLLFNRYLQWCNFILLLFLWGMNVEFIFNDQMYAIMFGILIINMALNNKVIFSLEYPLLNFLGKISFGIYVYHLIAFDLGRIIYQDYLFPTLLNFILGLFLTVILSTISYYLIEKPFLRSKLKKYTMVNSGNN